MTCTAKRSALVLLTTSVLLGPPAAAQDQVSARVLQIGPGVWPGLGAQLGVVRPRTIYALEAILYLDGRLGPGNRRSSLQVSGGFGAALRPLGIVRAIGNAEYAYDVYLGIRFGPSLLFMARPTRSDKNRQFSLFLDPYVRFCTRFLRRQTAFVELGAIKPSLRFGLWVDI